MHTHRRGGHLYICGKISMAEGVETALRRVLATSGSLEEMRRLNRYQKDIFG